MRVERQHAEREISINPDNVQSIQCRLMQGTIVACVGMEGTSLLGQFVCRTRPICNKSLDLLFYLSLFNRSHLTCFVICVIIFARLFIAD